MEGCVFLVNSFLKCWVFVLWVLAIASPCFESCLMRICELCSCEFHILGHFCRSLEEA